jgi:SNF2 family DNA or RNA helicase
MSLLKSKSYKPREYQKQAIEFAASRNYAGLFLDPGLGKTSIALAVIKLLIKFQGRKRALVVAPIAVMMTSWPDEINGWTEFSHFRVSVIHGTLLERLKALAVDADIYIINPENLMWLAEIGFRNNFCDILIVDESTKFKNPSAKRLAHLAKFLGNFKNRYILTGTPIPKGLHDIWAQVFLLDGGEHLGRKITHFRNNYFNARLKGNYVDYVAAPFAKKQIQDKISGFCLRMKAEDHIDMPQLYEYEVEVDLPDKIVPLYKEMENELFASLTKGNINAANAGVLTGKLHQIAQGAVYLSPDPFEPEAEIKPGAIKEWEHIHDVKLDRLDLLLDELEGQKVIVAYNFKHDAVRLQHYLDKRFKKRGGRYLHLGAGAKPSLFKTAVDGWNNGNIELLMVQPHIVAHGLNIQFGGHHIIMFANTYNFEHYDQLRRRLYRPGQANDRVIIHRIVTRGTVDLAIIGTLDHRETEQSDFVKALEHYKRKQLSLAA